MRKITWSDQIVKGIMAKIINLTIVLRGNMASTTTLMMWSNICFRKATLVAIWQHIRMEGVAGGCIIVTEDTEILPKLRQWLYGFIYIRENIKGSVSLPFEPPWKPHTWLWNCFILMITKYLHIKVFIHNSDIIWFSKHLLKVGRADSIILTWKMRKLRSKICVNGLLSLKVHNLFLFPLCQDVLKVLHSWEIYISKYFCVPSYNMNREFQD